MGWLFRSSWTRKELIAERTKDWSREKDNGITVTSTCLAHCYRGNVYSGVLWAVWERRFLKDGQETRSHERWISCDLMRHQKNDGWGHKDLCESEHPYYYSCPMKYLNLVPIDQYGGNPEWREQVLAHHARRKEKRQAV
jgi:hypothetical protein